MDPPSVEPLWQLIQQHPTFGYRHLWAMLRGQTFHCVTKKAVYRVLRQKRVVLATIETEQAEPQSASTKKTA